jgi:hypothetical protein
MISPADRLLTDMQRARPFFLDNALKHSSPAKANDLPIWRAETQIFLFFLLVKNAR